MKTQFVFKYIYENDHQDDTPHTEFANNKEIVITLNGEQSLTQIFEEFRGFLQSAGYVFGMNDYIDKFNDFESDYSSGEEDDEESLDDPDYQIESQDSIDFEMSENNPDPLLVSGGGYAVDPDTVDEYMGIPKYETTTGKDLDEEKILAIKNEVFPFLETLKQNPEKTVLRWPNRSADVSKKIDSLREILGE